MSLLNDLSDLVKEEVISQETADKIQRYYNQNKRVPSTSRLFTIFGILGSILIGLGIILIIAHNWDKLARLTKTIFSFMPLVVAQILSGYTLVKQSKSETWRESSATLLFFSVGASISLISQVYNIPGDLGSFTLIWMLLCIPLVYLMKSSITSLLYLLGITFYAFYKGYWGYSDEISYVYWFLLLIALPYYYRLYKSRSDSNFTIFHNWLIPLSVTISLGTIVGKFDEFMFISYCSLFGLFHLIGEQYFFKQHKKRNNSYRILGAIGTVVILMMTSFNWFWNHLLTKQFDSAVWISPELYSAAIISLLTFLFFIRHYRHRPISSIDPHSIIFILFLVTFLIGLILPVATVMINIIAFFLGIMFIRNGAKQNHLGLLNYGLLIITALIICRFFDTDLSFVIRGVLFVLVGIGFFISNYWMLTKRRKINE